MQLATLSLEGAKVITVYDEATGEKFVALKPIVEVLGLDWGSQRKKLARLQREGVAISPYPVPTAGGVQEMLFIRVEDLPAYLYSINSSKVKPELREKLVKFKKETVKVINDYWNKGAVVNPRVNPADLKAVIQEALKEYQEQRQELLEQIKLEKVRALTELVATLKDIPRYRQKIFDKPH